MGFPKIRDITLEILKTCGISSPPVDLGPILKHYKATVVSTGNIEESALLRAHKGWTIKVNRGLREERRAFRVAHEIGHIYWSTPDHHLGDSKLGGKLEKYCSKFASLLLCPHQWFIQDAQEADYELFALKKIYSNVSHEVLALRLSYLTPMVVAIYDNGKLYRRFSSPGTGFFAQGQKPEKEIHEAVDLYGEFREAKSEIKWNGIERKVQVRGYPVFSGKYRRIILLTKPVVSVMLDESEFEEDMPYPFPEY